MFDNYIFRSSSSGSIMTDSNGGVITANQLERINELLLKQNAKPLTKNQTEELAELIEKRDKKFELSKTTKAHLIECWVRARYKRDKDIVNKYMLKGQQVEQDSATIYSRVKKKFYKKNEERLSNSFITGEVDLFEGEEIRKSTAVIDLKSAWNIWSFFEAITTPISKDYWWQIQCYGALTGASELRLAYCLVNTPESLIRDEERKLFYRMQGKDDGPTTMESPLFIEAAQELRKTLVFDDIDIHERVSDREFKYDPEAIKALYERIPMCRAWMSGIYDALFAPKLLKG